MRKLLMIICLTVSCASNAQTFDFASAWKRVEKGEKEGELTSLRKDVEQIYAQAQKMGDSPQRIKSLLYLSQIKWTTDDDVVREDKDSQLEVIETISRDAIAAKGVEKLILQCYLAQSYYQYAQSGSYLFRHTTPTTTEADNKNFKSWSIQQFDKEIVSLYRQIHTEKKLLQQIATTHYTLLLTQTDSDGFKPTLYDILIPNYIDYLENGLQKNKTLFATTRLDTAAMLRREMTEFHQRNSPKDTYLHWRMQELCAQYAHNPSELSVELEKLADVHQTQPYATYLYYQAALATERTNRTIWPQVRNWNPVGSTDYARMHMLCTKGVVQVQKNKWSSHCSNKLAEIEQKELRFEVAKYQCPDTPIALSIEHRNVSEFQLCVSQIPIDTLYRDRLLAIEEQNYKYGYNLREALPPLKEIIRQDVTLKPFDDYATHKTIYKMESLPKGLYTLQTTPSSTLQTIFSVGTIRPIVQLSLDNTLVVQFVDVQSGKAIANQKVQLWRYNTNKRERKEISPLQEEGKTDKSGIYRISTTNSYARTACVFYFPNHHESCVVNTAAYSYQIEHHEVDAKKQLRANIFTDRSIYRPGQTVHFKLILTTQTGEHSHILPHRAVAVALLNSLGKEVARQHLMSNEYGSVAGTFTLPLGNVGAYRLTTLNDLEGDYEFSVEEYKRPKFEVTLDSLTIGYTLGQTIKITGLAQAYTGSHISNAGVTYRIERRSLRLWRNWFAADYWTPFSDDLTTVGQGETITDAEGKFNFDFEALPAEEKKEGHYRSYRYTISVEVTDINGETQVGVQDLKLGDLPKQLELGVKSNPYSDEFTSLTLKSTNLSGIATRSKGTLNITRLMTEYKERVLQPHKHFTTDYALYDYKTFVRAFPLLPYTHDDGKYKKKEKIVFTTQFDVDGTSTIHLTKPLPPGKYLVEAYTLHGSDTISTVEEVEVYDRKTLRSAGKLFFKAKLDKTEYQVGEKATLLLMTDLEEGTVQLRTERNRTLGELQEISLNRGDERISFQITEQDRIDGFTLHATFISNGDYAVQQIEIPIKAKEQKRLEILTETFRDKLKPNEKEQWKFTIRGIEKEKLMAEVVAAMYDASLDQFSPHDFNFYIPNHDTQSQTLRRGWYAYYQQFLKMNATVSGSPSYPSKGMENTASLILPQLNWFGFSPTQYRPMYMSKSLSGRLNGVMISEASSPEAKEAEASDELIASDDMIEEIPEQTSHLGDEEGRYIRKNLDETAFFFPQITTDEEGNFTLTFTSPEALTKWKLLLFAHTKEMRYGKQMFTLQTQKELMIIPNAPRFVREGDKITFSAKITNLSPDVLHGEAELQLFDALTDAPVDKLFENLERVKPFAVKEGQNSETSWTLQIPTSIQALRYRVIAKAGSFADGEENVLPILNNRMLVTETLPLSVREGETKHYEFEKLSHSNQSSTIQNYSLTLELTTNPIWQALFSLPYLREYPYECSEQIFARLYGNLLSQKILNDSPQIKRVFDEWRAKGMLKSPLHANEELKNLLLEETPWLNDAIHEEEQMKRLALLFDLNNMAQELEQTQEKLLAKQNFDGGFPWFEGGSSNSYISLHLVAGFGKLTRILGNSPTYTLKPELLEQLNKLVSYVDTFIEAELDQMDKTKKHTFVNDFVHYYYARSFWLDKYPLPDAAQRYLKTIKDVDHKKQSLAHRALTAIMLQRYGFKDKAQQVVRSLKERATISQEMGVYWKENVAGWYWYQAPVETQTALIEAFAEVTPNDLETIEAMKVWLLKQRQTSAWPTTKATTEAIYALIHFGHSWATIEDGVTATWGDKRSYPTTSAFNQQHTGYHKEVKSGSEITSKMARITLQKDKPGVVWGALYWQYFEELDRITQASSDIKIEKSLYIKRYTDNGPLLTPLSEAQVGDLITVRLIIKTDRDMEYIHIKDMRAAGFEPTQVHSAYEWQNGVGYYQSTRDAATHFFIDYLPKGHYLFEYELRANNAGNFSNGITTVQNMYAPEMAAHTQGCRVVIVRR